MRVAGSVNDNNVKSMQSHRNLKIDCSSNTQVVVKAGSAVAADTWDAVIEFVADRTVDITASGAGGLDTGSEAANTWYYIWAILNPVSGAYHGLLSASATSPTLPSGYTKKRLVGAVRNDGSSNFIPFKQVGNVVYFANLNQWILTGGSATSFTAVSVTSYIPVSVAAQGLFWSENGGTVSRITVGFDGSNTYINPGQQNEYWTMPHSGTSIYYKVTSGSGANILVQGFFLDL